MGVFALTVQETDFSTWDFTFPKWNGYFGLKIKQAYSGLPAGANWDNIESINNGQYAGHPAAAVAMITEWWYGL